MDALKWKSVVISIDAYKKLKKLAKDNNRTISGQFTHILETALNIRGKDDVMSADGLDAGQ
tara:strand:- start:624 stop:806 length:183 start_codon:yes stop_codon:yes gene_type:complete